MMRRSRVLRAVEVMNYLPEARLLAGFVVWQEEQLVWEILRNVWLVSPACSRRALGKEADR